MRPSARILLPVFLLLAPLALHAAPGADSDWPAAGERRVSFDAGWRFRKAPLP